MKYSRQYYVYIMSNYSRTLYIGVTNNLVRRVSEHRQGVPKGFTARYNVKRLVYYEAADSIITAIEREKQLKGWLRRKKVDLIESVNPKWRDLWEDISTG